MPKLIQEQVESLIRASHGDMNAFIFATHCFLEGFLQIYLKIKKNESVHYFYQSKDLSFTNLLFRFYQQNEKNIGISYASHAQLKEEHKLIEHHNALHSYRHQYEIFPMVQLFPMVDRVYKFLKDELLKVPLDTETKKHIHNLLNQGFHESNYWVAQSEPEIIGNELEELRELYENLKDNLYRSQKEQDSLLKELEYYVEQKNSLEREKEDLEIYLEEYITLETEKELEIKELKKELRNSPSMQQEVSLKVLEQELLDLKQIKDRALYLKQQEIEELIDQLKEAPSYQTIEDYLQYAQVFYNYLKNRNDFEQSLKQLSPEQKEFLEKQNFNNISSKFLFIKGGAGTGKTLLLIKILEKILKTMQEPSIILLTYTTALTQYNTYTAKLFDIENSDYFTDNIDSFFYKIQKQLDPLFFDKWHIDFDIHKEFFKKYRIKDKFIQSHLIDSLVAASFNRERSLVVQEIIDNFIAYMGETRRIHPEYFHILLLEQIQEQNSIKLFDFILIDESQDLSDTSFKILELLSKKQLILAGDLEQSIYQMPQSTYQIDEAFRSYGYILKTNFRNTKQIVSFCEYFRKDFIKDSTSKTRAFREGPFVELLEPENSNQRFQLTLQKIKLLQLQGYSLENIMICIPNNRSLEKIKEKLSNEGIHSINIKDKKYVNTEEKQIVLSTIHSAKGIDTPIMLLYLDSERPLNNLNKEIIQQEFHLYYVALSRPMHALSILLPNKEKQGLISETLKKAFEQSQIRK